MKSKWILPLTFLLPKICIRGVFPHYVKVHHGSESQRLQWGDTAVFIKTPFSKVSFITRNNAEIYSKLTRLCSRLWLYLTMMTPPLACHLIEPLHRECSSPVKCENISLGWQSLHSIFWVHPKILVFCWDDTGLPFASPFMSTCPHCNTDTCWSFTGSTDNDTGNE